MKRRSFFGALLGAASVPLVKGEAKAGWPCPECGTPYGSPTKRFCSACLPELGAPKVAATPARGPQALTPGRSIAIGPGTTGYVPGSMVPSGMPARIASTGCYIDMRHYVGRKGGLGF